jgi:hypothetical protein
VGKAAEVPGSADLNTAMDAQVNSVSCASAGYCSSAGNCSALDGASVVTERNGPWGTAEKVRGLARLNKDRNAAANSLSCPSARNCVAVGYYTDGRRHTQAFVGGAK